VGRGAWGVGRKLTGGVPVSIRSSLSALEPLAEALPQVFLHEAEPRVMHSSAEHWNEKNAT